MHRPATFRRAGVRAWCAPLAAWFTLSAGAARTQETEAELAPQSQAAPTASDPAQSDAPTPSSQAANDSPQSGAPNATVQPGALPVSTTPTAPLLPAYEPRYRSSTEAALWCDSLELAAPERVRRFDLATTRDGRPTPALEIAAPGPLPPAQRPTLLVIGALDGRSLAGAEAALFVARELAQQALELSPNLTVIVLPFGNVEALDLCKRDGAGDGRTLRPIDDDRDGALDEDGPDDLDDDGLILEMLVESPRGTWTFGDDPRWILPAQPGDGRRFLRVREGRDDDGDGLYNEDGPGGVDLDRNFPVGREGPWADASVGALPLCEPVSRALAELARSRRCFSVLLLQGAHGGVAHPGGVPTLETWSALDRGLYEELTERFALATGRAGLAPRALRIVRGANAPGAALDWFAASCGALALEIAPWGPQVEGGAPSLAQAGVVQPARFDARAEGQSERWHARHDREWARWLDEHRNGLGYVAWRPVDLRNGRAAFVGGFEPWTVETPPAESLERALTGMPRFVRAVCDAAPRLEFGAVTLSRSAGVLRVRANLRNAGVLPTGLRASGASSSAEPLRLALEIGAEHRLLAGSGGVRLEPLAGGGLSRDVEWIVLAPAPAVLTLRASGGWCAPVVREVRE